MMTDIKISEENLKSFTHIDNTFFINNTLEIIFGNTAKDQDLENVEDVLWDLVVRGSEIKKC